MSRYDPKFSSDKAWNQHHDIVDMLSNNGQNMLRNWVSQHPDATEEEFRAFYQELVARHADTGSKSAFNVMQECRTRARYAPGGVGFNPRKLPELSITRKTNRRQIDGSITYAIKEIGEFKAVEVATFLITRGYVDQIIRKPARDTVWENTRKAGTRFMRIPGASACSFCIMLGGRGAVYHSKESAGATASNRYHVGCTCSCREVLVYEDIPPEIRALAEEYNKVIGLNAPLSTDTEEKWRHYLYSSRGHDKNSFSTFRPTPPVLLHNNKQIHAYRKGLTADYTPHPKALTAQQLRAMETKDVHLIVEGGWHSASEEFCAKKLAERNNAPIYRVRAIGNLTKAERQALNGSPSQQAYTPDAIIGDKTVEFKRITYRSGKTSDQYCNTISAAITEGRHQASCVVVDATEVNIDRDKIVDAVLDEKTSKNHVEEILILGKDSAGEYEVVWP